MSIFSFKTFGHLCAIIGFTTFCIVPWIGIFNYHMSLLQYPLLLYGTKLFKTDCAYYRWERNYTTCEEDERIRYASNVCDKKATFTQKAPCNCPSACQEKDKFKCIRSQGVLRPKLPHGSTYTFYIPKNTAAFGCRKNFNVSCIKCS